MNLTPLSPQSETVPRSSLSLLTLILSKSSAPLFSRMSLTLDLFDVFS